MLQINVFVHIYPSAVLVLIGIHGHAFGEFVGKAEYRLFGNALVPCNGHIPCVLVQLKAFVRVFGCLVVFDDNAATGGHRSSVGLSLAERIIGIDLSEIHGFGNDNFLIENFGMANRKNSVFF